MQSIQLSRGLSAIVSDSDYELLSKYSWYAKTNGTHWYAATTIQKNGKKKSIRMHRLIMGVTDPSVLIDHKNGCTLDNSRDNLRVCNTQQNAWNKATNGKDIGIQWSEKHKYWLLEVKRPDKTSITFSGFSCKETAKFAYNVAMTYYRGEFATLNKVDLRQVSLSQLNEVVFKVLPRWNGVYWDSEKKKFKVYVKGIKPSGVTFIGAFLKREDAEAALAPYVEIVERYNTEKESKRIGEVRLIFSEENINNLLTPK